MAQRREPGVLVLAKELSAAIEKHVEDREYSPTYLISEIGAKLSRVLIGGYLRDLENRGDEDEPNYFAQIIDPSNNRYYLQAGHYDSDAAKAALAKLDVGIPVLCVGKARAWTPEDGDRTYVSVRVENIRAVSEDEVNHWAIKACDGLLRRINANKAFEKDEDALKRANLTTREMDGLELSKGFYPTVAVENYAALLYDCLTKLAGGDLPETKKFTGEFEPAGAAPETEIPEVKKTVEEAPEKESPDDHETKIIGLIKEMDEGDGIYYDDLGSAALKEGVDGPMLDEILDSLSDQGLIFQPRFNHYKEA